MSNNGDYEIGYGKPPKSGQFKKGRSGNPKGRPKARKSLGTTLDDVFRRKITIREGGKTKSVSSLEALARRVLNDGLKGDAKATDQAIRVLSLVQNLHPAGIVAMDGDGQDNIRDQETIAKFLELFELPTDARYVGFESD